MITSGVHGNTHLYQITSIPDRTHRQTDRLKTILASPSNEHCWCASYNECSEIELQPLLYACLAGKSVVLPADVVEDSSAVGRLYSLRPFLDGRQIRRVGFGLGHGRVVLLDPCRCLVRSSVDAEEAIDKVGVSVQVGDDIFVDEGQNAAGVLGLEEAADTDVKNCSPTVHHRLPTHDVRRAERPACNRIPATLVSSTNH